MANVMKYTKSSMGGLCKHYERKKDENGNYIKFGNQEIDLSKTDENYNLAPEHKKGQVGFINNRLSEVQCLNRADVKVMCSWVVTLPKSFPEKQEKEFFEKTYDFLKNKYGEENTISAYVHKDENQPHLHFAFIPVCMDRNKQIEKVSAKEVLTKSELQNFHPELEKTLEQHFGFEVGILNGATLGGNRTVKELKAEQESQKYDKIVKDIEYDVSRKKEQIMQVESSLSIKKKNIQIAERKLQKVEKNILSYEEISALEPQTTITGAIKGITLGELERLKSTALNAKLIRDDYIGEQLKNQRLSGELQKVREENKTLTRSPKIISLEQENRKLKALFEGLKKRLSIFLEKLPDFLKEELKLVISGEKQNKSKEREHER